MSVELLVLAGEPTPQARQLRHRVMDHAINHVPRALDASTYESDTAIAALVFTVPAGGTLSGVEREREGLRLTVATGDRGLIAARDNQECGAEGGHVTVLLKDDGGVVLSTDGVGFLPCYWGRSETTLKVSTHLATLVSLGVPSTVDEQALVEYVVTLSPLGVRTLLRDATVLMAGGRLLWRPDRWTQPPAASGFSPSSASMADTEAIAALAAVWPQVVADAASGARRTVIGLSGGLDSRAIAEAAANQGLRPVTYTYGAPPSREPIVASRVAAALGLPNIRIPVPQEGLLTGAVRALDVLDGAHSPSEMYELWFGDVLSGFADTVINGNAGGPLWGDDKAFGLISPGAVVAQRLRGYAGAMAVASRYLSHSLAAEVPGLMKRGLLTSLAGWDLGARDDMVIFWRVQNRQFRWGNMLTNAFRRSGIRTEAPFLDSRFLALASRFTADQRRNGNLYLRMYRDLFPRTAAIPRANDGNAPRALNHVYWSADTPYLRQLGTLTLAHPVSGARRAVRQARDEAAVLVQRRTGITGPADRREVRRSVFPADLWLRSQRVYADRLSELLQLGDHPLFSQQAIDSALIDIREGRLTTPALALGKVAAARGWLSDYERRASALQHVLAP